MIHSCGDSRTLREYCVQELNGAEQPGRGRARILRYAGEQKVLRYPAGFASLTGCAVPDRAPPSPLPACPFVLSVSCAPKRFRSAAPTVVSPPPGEAAGPGSSFAHVARPATVVMTKRHAGAACCTRSVGWIRSHSRTPHRAARARYRRHNRRAVPGGAIRRNRTTSYLFIDINIIYIYYSVNNTN